MTISDNCCWARRCGQPVSIVIRGIPLCEVHEARSWDALRSGKPDRETILELIPRQLHSEVQ